MKLLYASDNWLLIHQLKDELEHVGIICILKNYYLRGGMGEIPPNECCPECWIINDNQFDDAKKILEDILLTFTKKPHGKSWQCTHCGEKMDPQFTACWKCGTVRQDENN